MVFENNTYGLLIVVSMIIWIDNTTTLVTSILRRDPLIQYVQIHTSVKRKEH